MCVSSKICLMLIIIIFFVSLFLFKYSDDGKDAYGWKFFLETDWDIKAYLSGGYNSFTVSAICTDILEGIP